MSYIAQLIFNLMKIYLTCW